MCDDSIQYVFIYYIIKKKKTKKNAQNREQTLYSVLLFIYIKVTPTITSNGFYFEKISQQFFLFFYEKENK